MATSLDDVLSEPEKPAEQPAVVEEPKVDVEAAPKEAVERARGPDGKFIKTEAEQAAETAKEAKPEKVEAKPEPKTEPKQEFSEKERAFLAAAHEERRKRQELERRLQEMEAQRTKEPPKQFWDNPEEALAQFKAEIQQQTVRTRLETAEMIARTRYTDFDEKVQAFGQILQQVPGMVNQWLSSPDPAEFAYKTAKNHMELQAVGSLDAMKSKMEKEIRASLEAELKEKAEKAAAEAAAQREALTPSLSGARGVTTHKPVWSGPTPLDGILKS